MKPLEQLPTERDRFAVGARFNKRMQQRDAAPRPALLRRHLGHEGDVDRLAVHGRPLASSSRLAAPPHPRSDGRELPTNLAYSAILDPALAIVRPARTAPAIASCSPLLTVTAGGGIRLGLGEPEGEVKYGITFVGDADVHALPERALRDDAHGGLRFGRLRRGVR